MSYEQLVKDQNELLKKQNATIADLTVMLDANSEKLRRASAECSEQHIARIAAESELSSRRFAHWAVHVVSAGFIAWALVNLVGPLTNVSRGLEHEPRDLRKL